MSLAEPSEAARPEPSGNRKSGVPSGPNQPKWHQRVAATLVFVTEHLLTASIRYRWQDESKLLTGETAQPVIFCIWHNRLALSMSVYRKYPLKQQAGRRMAALVSASKDGALLAAILQRFGVEPVRGSTSRRGPQALLELTSWAERGYDLAITPDGPRGPRYIVQEGVIALAQLTGLPIVPVSCWLARKVSLQSWDRFQIPLPWTTCKVCFHAPVWVPRDASESERQTVRQTLQERLLGNNAD
jgi:lysophospholipid acyltransferase (LPLAT)-like uncharacterized protein